MRQYIISEEELKYFIRTIRELSYENDPRFYMPSDEELEPTEEDLAEYTEIKVHEYVPDIDFDSTGDKTSVTVEIVGVVKHEPDFSDIDND